MNISIVIITLNEEHLIGKCIDKALEISEDIILIDAQSSDKTVEIAEEKGARVFIREWKGFGPAKNFGNQKAKYDWILSLDADEILSTKLIHSIKTIQLKDEVIYQLDLQTIIAGKKISHSGFYPSWKKRLFNKLYVEWNQDDVHEALTFKKGTDFQKVKGKLWHYSGESWEDFACKQDKYAYLSARNWVKNGDEPTSIRSVLGPSFKFIMMYFIKLGILDGPAGLRLARIMMKANRKKYNYFKKLSEERSEK